MNLSKKDNVVKMNSNEKPSTVVDQENKPKPSSEVTSDLNRSSTIIKEPLPIPPKNNFRR